MEKNIKIDVKKFVVSRLNNGLTKKDLALKTGVYLYIKNNMWWIKFKNGGCS